MKTLQQKAIEVSAKRTELANTRNTEWFPLDEQLSDGDLKKKLDKTFTIDEIEDVWFSIFNEELKDDYPRFLDELEQQLK